MPATEVAVTVWAAPPVGGVAAVGAGAQRGAAAAGDVDEGCVLGAVSAPGRKVGAAALRSVRLTRAAGASCRRRGRVTEVAK